MVKTYPHITIYLTEKEKKKLVKQAKKNRQSLSAYVLTLIERK